MTIQRIIDLTYQRDELLLAAQSALRTLRPGTNGLTDWECKLATEKLEEAIAKVEKGRP